LLELKGVIDEKKREVEALKKREEEEKNEGRRLMNVSEDDYEWSGGLDEFKALLELSKEVQRAKGLEVIEGSNKDVAKQEAAVRDLETGFNEAKKACS